MNVKIDKGIPIPELQIKTASNWDFLKGMDIGDSFLIPPEKSHKSAMAEIAVRCKKWKWGKFSRRKTDDGVRVWRVE